MICVDDPMPIGGRFNNWCHMWSSLTDVSPEGAIDELHEMATRIGLRIQWFQQSDKHFPHYDLSPKHRRKALAAGAVYMPLRQWIAMRKEQANG